MAVLHVNLKHLGIMDVGIIPMLVIAIGLGTSVMVLHELWVRAWVYKRIISPLSNIIVFWNPGKKLF
jgi:hypothetical protein